MKNITIGVSIICGDEDFNNLKSLLNQLSKFDQVVIGYNGKDEKKLKYIKNLSKPFEVVEFEWRPTAEDYELNEWGFSYARNQSWNALTTSHAIWLDTDDKIGYMKSNKEVIVTADQAYNAFKKIALEAPEDINIWLSTYVYSRDAYNNPNIVHARERMIKRPQEWKWVYPIHEILVPPEKPSHAVISDVQFIHFPQQKEDPSTDRNLRMLSDWYEQLERLNGNPHDVSRCLMYLGDTYWARNEWKQSAAHFMEFIKKFPKALDMEKWQAWVFMAKCQIELCNFEAASAAALAAIEIEPGLRDGYILLAQNKLLTDQDPQDILLLIETAARMEKPHAAVIQNPLDYTYTPYCIVSRCKYLLGQYDAALEWAIKACEICPGDDRSQNLRVDAAYKVREQDAVRAAEALYQLLIDFDENEKAARLYEVLPYVAQDINEVKSLAINASNAVAHLVDDKDYIRLYDHNDNWTPTVEDFDYADQPRCKYMIERLKASVPRGGVILDVGCSDGFYSMEYAKLGYKVVGIDIDPRCVEHANERAKKLGVDARFVQGFFERINPEIMVDNFFTNKPFYKNFDAVIAGEIIEHVQNPEFFIGCLSDCAKDGAPIIITTPDGAYDKGEILARKNPTGMTEHVRIFTQDTFENLLKKDSDLNVVESHFLPNPASYRDHQGWQVGEIKRAPHPNGPIIRIWCGPRSKFAPDSLEDKNAPIAGSEIAVVHMAKHFARMGCQVVVYSGVNGVYDGVFYRTTEHFDIKHYSDIFISWRLPTIFERERPNAKTTVLWCHDLYFRLTPDDGGNDLENPKDVEIPQEWVDRIDKVVTLSKFHDAYTRKVHKNLDGKTWISRNGIDPWRYLNRNIEKQPHKYFYSSSWERGIDYLVEIWPQIKEAIPDAELHVAYSYDLVKSYYKTVGDTNRLREIEKIYGQLKTLPGCVYHDRLGQQELADLQLSCEAWLYPPNSFLETYCITAVEAQAAGCVPVTRLNGALSEATRERIEWLPDSDIVSILRDTVPAWQGSMDYLPVEHNREWALSQSWESLAVEWLRELAPQEEKND